MSTNYEGLEFIAEHAATKQAHDMELRDYFAAKALAAMISNTTRSVDLGVSYPQNNANFALASYAVADAMLAARSA